MSRNIHTLQELNKNKSTNNQRNTQYNRGNTMTETVTDTETEQVTIPKSHFYNIL